MTEKQVVIFACGTYENYKALNPKDNNTLYFVEDKGCLYKGAVEYGGGFEAVDAWPTDPEQGKLYILKETGEVRYYTGTEWNTIAKEFVEKIEGAGDPNTVPTTKAVADFVDAKIAGVVGSNGIFVTDVSAKDNAVLTINKGTESSDVALTGVVSNPTYDQATRTITLPVAGKTALTIALGKDLAVRAGKYNEATKEIWLTLAEDGTYTDASKVVKIPAQALVDIYTGVNTATVNVMVSADKKISAEVNISTKTGNQLQKVTTVGQEGLYVPATDISGKLDKVASGKANEVIIANADGTVAASGKTMGGAALNAAPTEKVMATEKAAKDYADGVANTAKTNAISAANSYTDTALEWKTF